MFGTATGQGQLIGIVYTGQLLGASGPCAGRRKHCTHYLSCCPSNTVSSCSILRQKLEIIS